MRTNNPVLGLLLGSLAVILFGASLPMTRLAVAALDPWFVTSARGAGAGLIAAAVLLMLCRPIPWPDLPKLFIVALSLVVGFPMLMAIAMTTVPSAHGGVILGLLPMATAIAAVFLAGERPSPFFWTMSALGAALVVIFSLGDEGLTPAAGDLPLFLAVAVCGAGYAISGSLARRMPGWEVISWAVVIGLPILLPTTIALWPLEAAPAPASAWLAVVYLAAISQYVGFFLWNSALAAGGVARIGQVQLLQPFATIIIAALMLGEAIDLRVIAFAAAVMAVVGLGLGARVAGNAEDLTPTPLDRRARQRS